MKRIYLLLTTLFLVVSACGGGDDSVKTPEITNGPEAALLLFPEKNSECNEGVILNDEQSTVTFRWNAAEAADSYEINLQNLNSLLSTKTESTTNSAEITLDRGAAYKWYVVSKSNETTETAQSESWQFYNAAPGVVNYAPFPAEAINPVNGSTVTSPSGKVTLSWEASDLDDDIEEYEVLYGTSNPPTSSSGVLTDPTFEFDVVSGNTFYWLVKTTDSENNASESEIFSFMVQ